MIINREQLKEVSGSDYYEGSVIHQRFAYKFFKKQVSATGDIVAYISPVEVTANLIDLEDAINHDYIYSDSMMNFIMEIPNIDLFGGIAFQRLFNAQVGSLLCSKYLDKEGYVDGDDIMVKDGDEFKKASVSIAAKKNDAVLVHLGINIDAGSKAPSFAYSTNLSEEKAHEFMTDVCRIFREMTTDIFIASTKIII